jgi:hypothetical protein
VAAIAPKATEVTHSKGLTFYQAERGGPVSAGICQILILPDHFELAFIHGAFLPGPGHLPEGERQYKKLVRIAHYEATPWDALKDLITASACFDPRAPRV